MRQDTRDFTQYPKKISLTDKAILALWILFLISLAFAAFVFALTMPASAAEINPSVDNQPIQCRYSFTKWICEKNAPGATGAQGINGTPGYPGQDNLTAIYYNSTNLTTRQNISIFNNVSSSLMFTNYTIYEGANFYNTTAINESYAYLHGRAGGQRLTGSSDTNGDLVLNGSLYNTGLVSIQPRGSNTIIGTTLDQNAILAVNGSIQQLKLLNGQGFYTQFYTTPTGKMYVSMGSGAKEFYLYDGTSAYSLYVYSGSSAIFGVRPTGSFFIMPSSYGLGIGTQSPTTNLHLIGNARITGLGAGTVTSDAGGNLTSVSDSKAKTNIATYSGGLAQVLQLSPKSYKYSPDSGLDTKNTYVGFIAQDVEKVLPDAVKTKDDVKYEQKLAKKGATAEEDEYTTVEVKTGTQTKSLDDRAIIAALVNALKEEDAKVKALEARIKALEEKVKP